LTSTTQPRGREKFLILSANGQSSIRAQPSTPVTLPCLLRPRVPYMSFCLGTFFERTTVHDCFHTKFRWCGRRASFHFSITSSSRCGWSCGCPGPLLFAALSDYSIQNPSARPLGTSNGGVSAGGFPKGGGLAGGTSNGAPASGGTSSGGPGGTLTGGVSNGGAPTGGGSTGGVSNGGPSANAEPATRTTATAEIMNPSTNLLILIFPPRFVRFRTHINLTERW